MPRRPASSSSPGDIDSLSVAFGRVRPLKSADVASGKPLVVLVREADGGWLACEAVGKNRRLVLLLPDGPVKADMPPRTMSYNGASVMLLEEATERLRNPSWDKTDIAGEALHAAHARARELGVFFGPTYYVSESVGRELTLGGDHMFSVNGGPPIRLHVDQDGRVDGCGIVWRERNGAVYATLREGTLYLLAGLQQRM